MTAPCCMVYLSQLCDFWIQKNTNLDNFREFKLQNDAYSNDTEIQLELWAHEDHAFRNSVSECVVSTVGPSGGVCSVLPQEGGENGSERSKEGNQKTHY